MATWGRLAEGAGHRAQRGRVGPAQRAQPRVGDDRRRRSCCCSAPSTTGRSTPSGPPRPPPACRPASGSGSRGPCGRCWGWRRCRCPGSPTSPTWSSPPRLRRLPGPGWSTRTQGHALAAAVAGLHGQPYWSGEWGWFGDPAGDGAKVAAYAAEEDRRLVGGAWWSWKQACGDPHVIGGRGREPERSARRSTASGARATSPLGIPPAFGDRAVAVLPAGGARGVAGRWRATRPPEAMSGQRGRRRGRRAGPPSSTCGCPTGASARPSSAAPSPTWWATPVPGGWRVTATATGDWSVSVSPGGRPAPPGADAEPPRRRRRRPCRRQAAPLPDLLAAALLLARPRLARR